MQTVSVSCSDAPRELCAAFEDMIRARNPGLGLCTDDTGAAADLNIELILLEQTETRLSARLRWSDGDGAVNGPPIDFHTSDTVIGPHVYKSFLKGLFIASKPPI